MNLKWKYEVTHCQTLRVLTQGVSDLGWDYQGADAGILSGNRIQKAIVLPAMQLIMPRLRYCEMAFWLLFL
ncbi:hypothetical protein RCO22_01715 [Pseudomonas yamanorum]|jgi:hypothetical protein|uniref:Uncharacterized protein n=1 Tax=Pseudomonas yamanorum TaxID=515393 RepID=A0ABU1CK42_9PSED|nr:MULTISPECIES: hypothetical protein [Pseudomonas]MBK5409350.1 hypothetical protein [Pseudomonas sp. TH34]MBV6660098.1 hypothetical protein [Pseudomonas yamanorum]MDR0187638.1 hypothetical protein [Pseudomonas yamanorum]NVZ89361.1 hypothetical protein [Pseudomonas yamanorum]